MKKVLIIRFSSIGDIILTTPILRCINQQLGVEVHYLTKKSFSGLLKFNPYVDAVHSIDKEIEFDLIENVTNRVALKKKSKLDIFIDQIGDKGGWGYGMNSIESLSMGICTLTEMNQSYEDFINDHPFVNVNKSSLEPRFQ